MSINKYARARVKGMHNLFDLSTPEKIEQFKALTQTQYTSDKFIEARRERWDDDTLILIMCDSIDFELLGEGYEESSIYLLSKGLLMKSCTNGSITKEWVEENFVSKRDWTEGQLKSQTILSLLIEDENHHEIKRCNLSAVDLIKLRQLLDVNVLIAVDINNNTYGNVDGAGYYIKGETVNLEAIPNDGYSFVKWSDEEISPTRTFEAIEDVLLTAYFEEN